MARPRSVGLRKGFWKIEERKVGGCWGMVNRGIITTYDQGSMRNKQDAIQRRCHLYKSTKEFNISMLSIFYGALLVQLSSRMHSLPMHERNVPAPSFVTLPSGKRGVCGCWGTVNTGNYTECGRGSVRNDYDATRRGKPVRPRISLRICHDSV